MQLTYVVIFLLTCQARRKAFYLSCSYLFAAVLRASGWNVDQPLNYFMGPATPHLSRKDIIPVAVERRDIIVLQSETPTASGKRGRDERWAAVLGPLEGFSDQSFSRQVSRIVIRYVFASVACPCGNSLYDEWGISTTNWRLDQEGESRAFVSEVERYTWVLFFFLLFYFCVFVVVVVSNSKRSGTLSTSWFLCVSAGIGW